MLAMAVVTYGDFTKTKRYKTQVPSKPDKVMRSEKQWKSLKTKTLYIYRMIVEGSAGEFNR